MLDTRTRLHISMPASRRANSKLCNLLRCLPTPWVKKHSLGTRGSITAETPGSQRPSRHPRRNLRRVAAGNVCGRHAELACYWSLLVQCNAAETDILLVDVHDLRRRKAVELGRRRRAVGADVLAVDQVADARDPAASRPARSCRARRRSGRRRRRSASGPFLKRGSDTCSGRRSRRNTCGRRRR